MNLNQETVFDLYKPFPIIKPDDKITTKEFLEASEGLVCIIG